MNIPININSKVALSLATVAVAGALIVGATVAFFSDTETSEGNILQAGSLDLKVDSEAHYDGLVCDGNVWEDDDNGATELTRSELIGQPCDGTWALKDLGDGDIFFNITDIKPGDEGENTISLHVFRNDAWGRFIIDDVSDDDNTCTEPESEVGAFDPQCNGQPNTDPGANNLGELGENLSFYAWIDQGSIPGFQCANPTTEDPGARCNADPDEGDNIQQCVQEPECEEPTVIQPGDLDPNGETHNIWEALAAVRVLFDDDCNLADDGDGDGHNVDEAGKYLACHGLADDGRLVGSATYYFGLGWSLPDNVGNEAQTDSLSADLSFEIEQHRNNPSPFPTPI